MDPDAYDLYWQTTVAPYYSNEVIRAQPGGGYPVQAPVAPQTLDLELIRAAPGVTQDNRVLVRPADYGWLDPATRAVALGAPPLDVSVDRNGQTALGVQTIAYKPGAAQLGGQAQAGTVNLTMVLALAGGLVLAWALLGR